MAASRPSESISQQGHEPEKCCPVGLPPAHFELSPYLFARIFFEAERQGYVGKQHKDKALHVLVLRRFLDRLSHLLQSPLDYDELDEKTRQATWISWKDMRMAFHRGYKPMVPLRRAEQLNMVLEDTNSMAGILFQGFILIIILVNCLLIAGLSFPEGTNACCTIIFTAEYLLKLACSPFTRRTLIKIENTIEQTVPSMSDPNMALAWTSSKLSRLRIFVLEPMNIIDLLAILPFWTNLALGTMHLGHMEALKFLRILRVLKISKYNRGFRLLGQVIAHSSHSFAAIAIYLGMLSTLFGPVISYFETFESGIGEPPNTRGHHQYMQQTEGGKIHLSIFWAASRFTSMQHSLKIKQAIPSHGVNQVLSRIIGLIKGFIFLTPLGEMQQAFKDLAAKQEATDALKVTVARQQGLTPDMDWLFEATTLSWGRIEIFCAADMDKVGLGYFNLPLGEIEEVGPVRQKVAIAIRHRRARIQCSFGRPMVWLEVQWKPWTALGSTKTVPRGELEIALLEGEMFPSHVSDTWRCRLHIPERLYRNGTKVWLSEPSDGAPGKPEWQQRSKYEVDWMDEADRLRSSKSVKQEPPLTSIATRLQAGVRYLDALERKSAAVAHDNSSLQTT